LTVSTIYLRRVVKTVLFFFKLQISYPFLSLTILWNTLTENKDKITNIVSKEAQKIFSNLNLHTIIYDYHINYFKEIFSRNSFQAINTLDLPLMFMHFATYFDQVSFYLLKILISFKPPVDSNNVFYGSNYSIIPGYLYTKFNPASVWHFLSINHKKYGLNPLVQENTVSHMFIFAEDSPIPLFEKLDPEDRPRVVLMTHTEESQKNNLLAEVEKVYLDQVYNYSFFQLNFTFFQSNLNQDFLSISYFVLYDKEATGLKLEEIKIEIEVI